jgi:hypothetical protein
MRSNGRADLLAEKAARHTGQQHGPRINHSAWL